MEGEAGKERRGGRSRRGIDRNVDKFVMRQKLSRLRTTAWRPARVFLFVLSLVFGVECAIMLALWAAPPQLHGRWAGALIDSVTLTAVLAPALWLALVRPLQRLSASRGQLLRQLFDAQEQERSRLARDLHDELGQHLTAVMIGLRTVEQAESLEQARERAHAVAEAGSASLREVRRMARGLRPTVLEDLGLATAVERLCEDFQSVHGVPVELAMAIESSRRFTPQLELCVFRVVQESLTNAAKHAAAKRMVVNLECHRHTIRLSVSDDGKGFDVDGPTRAWFGLIGMRERVEMLHGELEVRSAPGCGTTIRAELPADGPESGSAP